MRIIQIVSFVMGVASTAGLLMVMTVCSAWFGAQTQFLDIFFFVIIIVCAMIYLIGRQQEEGMHSACIDDEETQMQGIYIRGRFK